MKGRKPVPPELKALHGGVVKLDRSRRKTKAKPTAPPCPAWLPPEAKREWRWLVPRLAKLNLIAELDRAVLASYVTAYARWKTAEMRLAEAPPVEMKRRVNDAGKELGGEFPVWNPYFGIANTARKQMHQALAELGLSPSSRTRLVAADRTSADDPLDILND